MGMLRTIAEGTRAREAAGVLLGGCAVLLLAALGTYHPDDPSFFAATADRPTNWIGPVGAQVAALFFNGFGLAAWLVPLMVAAACLRRFRPPGGTMRRSAVAGLVIVSVSTALLLALIVGQIQYRGALLPAGGVFGYTIAHILSGWLSDIGSLVVAGTTLLVGLVLAARSSLAETTASAADVVRRGAGAVSSAVPRPKPARLRAFLSRLRPRWPFRRTKDAAGDGTTTVDAITSAPLDGPIVHRRGKSVAVPADTTHAHDEDDAFAQDEEEEEDLDGDGTDEDDDQDEGAAEGAEDTDDETEEDTDDAPAPRAKRRRPARIAPRPRQAKLPMDIPLSQAKLPPVDLLTPAPPQNPPDKAELLATARQIESRCAEFSVDGHVLEIHPGPVVTTYEFRPNAGIKVTRITSLADDLALGLEAESVRVERIPGRPTVGIEVPNKKREVIALREVLEADVFRRNPDLLTVALGKTQEGEISCASLAKMPHVLIAGSTGSGKSVGLNGIITSILYRARPDEVKFILVDPKMLELGLYDGIPHLLVPVVTDMKQASNALKWAVREMERRYRLLAACNTRHLDAFNRIVTEDPKLVEGAIATIPARGQVEKYEAKRLPYIIIVVDELADMLMTTGQETEESIARLAQKARAVGIHLVLATQRPSVDVLTGTIKANFPARVAYRVASKIDSRTILDGSGAERLLGAGDMLYKPPGSQRFQRVHGAFVSEDENLRVVHWLKKQARADYDKSILDDPPEAGGEDGEGGGDIAANDPMYNKAVRLVVATGQASTSFLQRRMRLGYSRAARIVDQMEQDGIVGPADGARPRQVLVDSDFLGRLDQMRDEQDEV